METDFQMDVESFPLASEKDGTIGSQKALKVPSDQNESTISENELECSLQEDSSRNDIESALKKYPTCKGDVELLDNAISAWKDQSSNSELMKKEIQQLKELNECNKKRAEEKIKELKKIIEIMQKDVDVFHDGLNLTDELHRDLNDLKVKYADLEAKIKAKSDDCIRMQEDNVISIKELKEFHSKEMENTKAEGEKKFRAMENEYKHRNDKLCEEIEVLNERVTKIEREKQSELSVLKIEYESKLAKLQLKRAAAPPQPQSSVLNQDIFRKKLHHLKLEYEQENNALKNQIRCLQQQLSQKAFGRKSTTK